MSESKAMVTTPTGTGGVPDQNDTGEWESLGVYLKNHSQLAYETLRRYGIRVEVDNARIVIANANQNLKKLLSETPWSRNWNNILRRLPGATEVKSARFVPGANPGRAVALPFRYLDGEVCSEDA